MIHLFTSVQSVIVDRWPLTSDHLMTNHTNNYCFLTELNDVDTSIPKVQKHLFISMDLPLKIAFIQSIAHMGHPSDAQHFC